MKTKVDSVNRRLARGLESIRGRIRYDDDTWIWDLGIVEFTFSNQADDSGLPQIKHVNYGLIVLLGADDDSHNR